MDFSFSLQLRNDFQRLGTVVADPLNKYALSSEDPLLSLSQFLIESSMYVSVTKCTQADCGNEENVSVATSPNVLGIADRVCNSALPSTM